MRYLLICLMLAALFLSGCSRPWEHPGIDNPKQADYQFDKDSTDCSIIASEQYPLNKDRQLPIYNRCMEDKGWKLHQRGEGIPLKK